MRTLLLPVCALAAHGMAQSRVPQLPPTAPEAPAAVAALRQGLPPKVLFDRPRGTDIWAIGHDWKAGFDGRGVTYIPFFGSEAPQNFPLRLELAEVRVGDERLALPAGTPREEAGTVTTDRGALVETVATTTDVVEQSFVFHELPTRGAIHVDLAVQTSLQATVVEGGLRFANEFGAVHYLSLIHI